MANSATAKLGISIQATDKASEVFLKFAETMNKVFKETADSAKVLQDSLKVVGETNSGKVVAEQMTAATEAMIGLTKETNTVMGRLNALGERMNMHKDMAAILITGEAFKRTGEQITGFFEEATKDAMDFNQKVTATGATLASHLGINQLDDTKLKVLNDEMLKLGKSGYFTANEISEAAYALAAQNLSYQDIIGGALKSVQDLAVAADSTMEDTGRVVSDIYHQMGNNIRDVNGNILTDTDAKFTRIADLVSGATHNARMSMNDFLTTMTYVGPVASASGQDLKELSTSIALLAEAGIRGNKAGTGLRTILLNLSKPTAGGAKAMKELGLATNFAFDAMGNMRPLGDVLQDLREKTRGLSDEQRNSYLTSMFGKTAVSQMTQLLQLSDEQIKKVTEDVTVNAKAHDLAQEKWDNAAGSIRRLNAHWGTIRKEIGELFLPLVQKVAQILEGLMRIWDNLSESQKKVLVTIGAVVGGLLLVTGVLITLGVGLGFVIEGLGAMGAALGITAETAAAVATPIGWIVLALAVLIPAIKQVYEEGGYFKDNLLDAFSVVSNWIKSDFMPFWNATWPKISGILSEAWNIIVTVVRYALNTIVALWKFVWPLLEAILIPVWAVIKSVIQVGLDIILGLFKIFNDILHGDWKKLWTDVKEMFNNIWNDLVSNAKTMVNQFIYLFTHIGETLSNFWTWVKPYLIQFGQNLWNWLINLPSNIVNSIVYWYNAWQQWSDSIRPVILAKLGEWWSDIGTWFKELPSKVYNELTGWKNSMVKWYNDMKPVISAKLDEWWDSMLKWFKDLPNKIETQLNFAKKKIGEFFDKLPAFAIEKLEKFTEKLNAWSDKKWKEDVLQLNTWKKQIVDWFEKMPDTIKAQFDTWWKSMNDKFDEIKDKIKSKVDDWWKGMKEKFEEIKTKIPTSLEDWWTGMKKWFSDMPGKLKKELDNWWNNTKDWFSNLGKKPEVQNAPVEISNGLAEGTKKNKDQISKTLGAAILDTMGAILKFIAIAALSVGIEMARRIMEGFKSSWAQQSKGFDIIEKDFKKACNDLVNNAVEWLSSLPGVAMGKMYEMGDSIANSWTYVKGKITELWNNITSHFKNMSIPTPHFKLAADYSFDDLVNGVKPITIEWHAQGGIFTKPTVLGNHGFGEAGAEAILPLSKLTQIFADTMNSPKVIGNTHNKNQVFNIHVEVNGDARDKNLGNNIAQQIRQQMSVVTL